MEKEKILELIKKAESLTPKKVEMDLEPIDGFPDVPNWHKYESDIWRIGEEIRQIIITKKTLRKDEEINDLIIKFCLNKNSKRGRQSFILLLGYKHLSKYASQLINMINDKFVNGQIIDTVYKMQAVGFEKEIRPFLTDKHIWIRKLAIKYIEKYGTQRDV
ncbi:hypothetical protein [uncultured Aquimarina sp.]|uniref:hypothetical protein n=1 Tax=uncultured Aquimarina sp. TaxID=575652 RepID=UPI0026172230|nr:hypothetical protein [uncultured Aquimarina sp.]